MIKPINHYSIENPSTIYDEEALTALQLAGRTVAKVNECVKKVNEVNPTLEKFKNETIPAETAKAVEDHIKNGAFTKELDEYTKGLQGQIDENNDRLDNLILNSGDSTPEVVDMRVGVIGNFATAGEAIRDQLRVLVQTGDQTDDIIMSYKDIVYDEYYHNTTGAITKVEDGDGEFARSKHLYPCKGGTLFTMHADNYYLEEGHIVWINCFDINGGYLGRVLPIYNGHTEVKATLPNTAFIGFTFGGYYIRTAEPEHIHFMKLGTVKDQGIAYPFNKHGDEYAYLENAFMGGNSRLTFDYDTYGVCVFKTEGVKSIYVNSTLLYNAIFFDETNGNLSHGEEYTVHGLGRLYTVPDEALYVVINIPYSGKDENGNPTAYIALTMEEGGELNGKRILCVGDSLTWLDGRSVAEANNTQLVGWQAELRKRGAIVDTTASSGATLAVDPTGSGAVCLCQQIVASYVTPEKYPDYTLSGYDVVIVMGGTNDIRLGVSAGSKDENVSNDFYNCCLSIIDCNSEAKVFMGSPLFSKSEARPMATVFDFVESMRQACQMKGASFINLCTDSGFNNGTIDDLTYDGTHPNRLGMKQLGRVIANHVEAHI